MLVVPTLSELTAAAAGNGVIPDVIDHFEPSAVLLLKYGSDSVKTASELAPEEAKDVPRVQVTPLKKLDSEAKYTLVVTDPDAPTRGDKKWSEYAHYIVSNIELNGEEGVSQELDLSKANTLLSYVGPGPPPKTGLHRYVAILYKQAAGKEPEAPADRPCYGSGKPGYGAREYSEKYSLEPLGIEFFVSKNADN